MAEVTAQTVEVQGLSAQVWRGGSGLNLVLLHGGIGDAELGWNPVWSRLANTYNVIAPDLPGFGKSAPLPEVTYLAMVEWLRRLLDEQGVGRVAVVGNSFGGALARLFAARFADRVSHLVLVDGGAIPKIPAPARALTRLPLLDPMFNMMRQRSFSPAGLNRIFADPAHLTPDFIARCEQSSVSFVQAMRAAGQSPLPHDRTPQSPTLIVWGEEDRLTPTKGAGALQKGIPASQVRMVKNAGHMPQVEQPEEFVSIVKGFVTPPC